MNMLLDQEFAELSARIEADYVAERDWQDRIDRLRAAEEASPEGREATALEAIRCARYIKATLVTSGYRSGAENQAANAIAVRHIDRLLDLILEIQ